MNEKCPPNTFSYTNSAGDTIYKLARKYDTTIAAIISANPGIEPDNLQIGQKICIPRQKEFPPCPERNFYTVKEGDTFYSIANSFNISVADLGEANPGVDPNNLKIGQVICIPLATPPVTCPPDSKTYIVKKGDTFYSIAKKFNISVDTLKKANPNINPEALLISQKLCIPQ